MHRELITFEVGGQVFGLDIMAIREIRAWTPTTMLPHVPAHVRGVVNLRGDHQIAVARREHPIHSALGQVVPGLHRQLGAQHHG
jgi:hypothetical protein